MLVLGATITNSQAVNELNYRNYFAAVSPAPTTSYPVTYTPTSPAPTITQAQILALSVDGSLQYYGYPKVASSPVTLNIDVWNKVVNYAIDISTQLTTQFKSQGYAVSGFGGLGALSWWDSYGPILLQIIGSAATIGGTAWQQQITRNQINQQVLSQTGASLPTGSQADANALAQKLMLTGMSAAEAQQRANNIVLGTPLNPPTTGLPSWALPAGIGILAFALLRKKA